MKDDSRSEPVDQQASIFDTLQGRSRTAAELAKRLEQAAIADGSQVAFE